MFSLDPRKNGSCANAGATDRESRKNPSNRARAAKRSKRSVSVRKRERSTVEEKADAEVKEIVNRLNAIEHESGWAHITAIGALIIENFFDGDPGRWHSRRRDRNTSLRRLVECGCALKKTALAEAVSVYVVSLEEPNVRTTGHISPSHVACLLKLERPARMKLLQEQAAAPLSVRKFKKRARAVLDAARDPNASRARPTATPAGKASSRLLQALSAVRAARGELAGAGGPLEAKALAAISEKLSSIQEEIRAAHRAVTRVDGSPWLARTVPGPEDLVSAGAVARGARVEELAARLFSRSVARTPDDTSPEPSGDGRCRVTAHSL